MRPSPGGRHSRVARRGAHARSSLVGARRRSSIRPMPVTSPASGHIFNIIFHVYFCISVSLQFLSNNLVPFQTPNEDIHHLGPIGRKNMIINYYEGIYKYTVKVIR